MVSRALLCSEGDQRPDELHSTAPLMAQMVNHAIVVAKLEHKMEILSALSMSNDSEAEGTFSFNLLGMNTAFLTSTSQ